MTGCVTSSSRSTRSKTNCVQCSTNRRHDCYTRSTANASNLKTPSRKRTASSRWGCFAGFLPAPIVYGLIIPLVFLDICVTIYQATCFPIFRIAKARRSNYIVIDHQHLAYLNIFEKFHCIYCSYSNGLLAYACEIAARTEQFFCPIKHAHKILGIHSHYAQFLDYGEAENFHARLMQLRALLAKEETAPTDDARTTPPKPHDI